LRLRMLFTPIDALQMHWRMRSQDANVESSLPSRDFLRRKWTFWLTPSLDRHTDYPRQSFVAQELG